MRRFFSIAGLFGLLLGGCAQERIVLTDEMLEVGDRLPADFSGSWARDYARSDTVDDALRGVYYELSRRNRNRGMPGAFGPDVNRSFSSELDDVMPLARLAELITRPDELTISQTDNEILIERLDDFAVSCSFYEGHSRDAGSDYGREICGWDGNRLVSHLRLPDGLEVIYRLTISDNGKQLRVVTTVASDTSKLPFTLSHFYWKFEKPKPKYECIETLSMKRVCATGELSP